MLYLSYKEVQDMLFKEKRKHQELLDKKGSQINKDYSRYAIFVISDIQRDFKKLFIKKYDNNWKNCLA